MYYKHTHMYIYKCMLTYSNENIKMSFDKRYFAIYVTF